MITDNPILSYIYIHFYSEDISDVITHNSWAFINPLYLVVWVIYIYGCIFMWKPPFMYTLWLFNIAMENPL